MVATGRAQPKRHAMITPVVLGLGLVMLAAVYKSGPSRGGGAALSDAAGSCDAAAAERQSLLPPPWQESRDCSVYILDVAKEVAPAAGLPACDVDSPEVWPLAQPGELPWDLQRMEAMAHTDSMYAAQWWLGQALRNASGVLAADIDSACLVWVDMHCYNQWFLAQRAIANRKNIERFASYARSGADMEEVLLQAWRHIIDSPRFQKRQGRDYVVHVPLPNPGRQFTLLLCAGLLYSHTLVVERSLSCEGRGRPKVDMREAQLVPYNAVADIDLSVPIVGSHRPTFLYVKATCGTQYWKFCGKIMRHAVVAELGGRAPDVDVTCANGSDAVRSEAASHAGSVAEKTRAVFCPTTPSDLPSTGHMPEVVLAGCIPVFIGPPWHELPFSHGEVDWAAFAVFIKVKEAAWLAPNVTICRVPLARWSLAADVTWAVTTVRDLDAAYQHLRDMPQSAVERRQAALQRERFKLYYGVAPGRRTSAAADIIFANALDHGRRLQAGELRP